MTSTEDILLLDEITALTPNDRQIALKMLIHERMNQQVLGKLTIDQIDVLEPHIAPFKLSDINTWIRQHPGFFEWLLAPDAFAISMQKAKQKAADTLIDLLDVNDYDESINPKILQVKMKAAELLLKSDMKREQRVNNTVKVNTMLPKHLRNPGALEEEIRKLKES